MAVDGGVPQGDQPLTAEPEGGDEEHIGQEAGLKVPGEGGEKPAPGALLPQPEPAVDGIIQGGAGGTGGEDGHTAQKPEQAQENAVGDLVHGDHQAVVGIYKIAEHGGTSKW